MTGKDPNTDSPGQARGWATLGRRARAWRVVHASWSVAQLGCLGYIWGSAVTGRRSPRLWTSVAFLFVEGGALVVGRGDCPVGPLQAEWGDPVPFFELDPATSCCESGRPCARRGKPHRDRCPCPETAGVGRARRAGQLGLGEPPGHRRARSPGVASVRDLSRSANTMGLPRTFGCGPRGSRPRADT